MIEVVKIGGNVIDNPEALNLFLSEFVRIKGRKILVHGGGKEATRLSKELSVETVMIEGRRVTDRKTLDIVTMVYAGLINKRIVAGLQSLGCNAVGLSGADGNIIPAVRRPARPVDYGFVGDIDSKDINVRFLEMLLDNGCVPVVCAICHDGEGTLLNCNADSVASAVAAAVSSIGETRLTFCFEKTGVLRDVGDESSLIPQIDSRIFSELKDSGAIADGMIPKIHNALESVRKGVREVRICKSENLNSSLGTVITEMEK